MYRFKNRKLSLDWLNLPDLQIDSWDETRRSELLSLFESTVYGVAPDTGFNLSFELIEEGEYRDYFRKQVRLVITVGTSSFSFVLLLYIPQLSEPSPFFINLNFSGNHTVSSDEQILLPQKYFRRKHYPPKDFRGVKADNYIVDEILESGYGFATVYAGDIDPDKKRGYKKGIRALFESTYTWKTIAAWSWGISRVMDYLETQTFVNKNQVVVVGHSRMGKAALWAAAKDERLAMAISNNSGCTGASLTRHRSGESLLQISSSFPHWFLDSYGDYYGREDDLPVDQHMLLALIAPRPVYVASATRDDWADQEGEFLSCIAVRDLYSYFGKPVFSLDTLPVTDEPIIDGFIGYHIRSGKHGLTSFDWRVFIEFANYHFSPKPL